MQAIYEPRGRAKEYSLLACNYKIGKLNHDPEREARIDWRAFGETAVRLCQDYGKSYYVKDDLATHLEGIGLTNTDARRVERE